MREVIIGILFLLLATNAFALQEVAGPLVMSIHVGGSNSAKYGLLNDGNETINVSITADSNIAKYLSFPLTVELQPGKLTYVNITASIPANYNSVGNITGYLYALQEGSPGQVKINVQLMKAVTIMAYGVSQTSNQTSQTIQLSQTNQTNQTSNQANQTSQVNQTNQSNQSSNQTSQTSNSINQLSSVTPATGLFALISSYSPVIVAAFVVLEFVYIIFKKRKNKRSKTIESDKTQIESEKTDELDKLIESQFKSVESDKSGESN